MQLGDGWNECLGGIPKVGVVAIWGHSGNGKSDTCISAGWPYYRCTRLYFSFFFRVSDHIVCGSVFDASGGVCVFQLQANFCFYIMLFNKLKKHRKIDIRVKVVDVPEQDAITKDNVSVRINAVIYYKIHPVVFYFYY